MLRWGKKVKVGVVYGGIEYTYIEWGGGSCLQYIYIYIYRRGKELDDDWKEVGWYFFLFILFYFFKKRRDYGLGAGGRHISLPSFHPLIIAYVVLPYPRGEERIEISDSKPAPYI